MVEHIAIGARGPGFNSVVSQIGHNVADGLPLVRCFFGAVLRRRKAAEMGLGTCYTLWCNTTSVMKILGIFLIVFRNEATET